MMQYNNGSINILYKSMEEEQYNECASIENKFFKETAFIQIVG